MAVPNSPQFQSAPQLSGKPLSARWQERFTFYDTYGAPSSPSYRAAFRALGFGKRMEISSNFLAFFFGPFYFYWHRMWKKGTTFLAVDLVLGIALSAVNMPDTLIRAIGIGLATLPMNTANYAYYLKRTRGVEGWNPFEGTMKR